jgi:thiamine-monophosphate kinase
MERINQIGEFELIERLNKILPIHDKDVLVGYGDDCACVNINGKLILFTVDIQVENSHFLKGKIKPEDLGWKLATSNVSDVVACGGLPRWALLSLTLPKDLEYSFIEKVYLGIKEAQDYYGFYTIGGNCSSSNQIMIDMVMVGETDKFISRSTAKPNQKIYLSGNLGCSKAGLELILMDKKEYGDFEIALINKHYRPKARIDLIEKIKQASACIDISDGLTSDLSHISKKSNVKIIIEKEKLKVDENLKKFCLKYGKDPLDYILTSGEEYEVALISEKDLDLIEIGYTEEGFGVFLKEGDRIIELNKKSFDHFEK